MDLENAFAHLDLFPNQLMMFDIKDDFENAIENEMKWELTPTHGLCSYLNLSDCDTIDGDTIDDDTIDGDMTWEHIHVMYSSGCELFENDMVMDE